MHIIQADKIKNQNADWPSGPSYQNGIRVPSNFECLIGILVPGNLALRTRHHSLKFDAHQALCYLMAKNLQCTLFYILNSAYGCCQFSTMFPS